jgi:hypothetical protein
MENYRNELVLGVLLLTFFSGLISWLILIGPQSPLIIGIALLTLFIGSSAFIWKYLKRRQDIKTGSPSEDEFTRMAKVYAGNQAFLYSMYLWLLIFVFNSSFIKNETMLGVGILGSAFIYGISLWYFNKTGYFYGE